MDRSLNHRPGVAGQIIVLFSIALVTIILFVGLVIDGGFAFLNRREAQNIADTAALAGTKVIADFYRNGAPSSTTSTTVYATIDAIAQANGCLFETTTPCAWTAQFVDRSKNVLGPVVNAPSGLPPNTQGITVTVTRTPPTYFLGVIGQTTWTISAEATALTAQMTMAPNGILIPIGINPPQPLEPGQTYILTETGTTRGGGNSPNFGPGNFGWLSWTGSNDAGSLAESICYPNNPAFTLPAIFPGDPGATNASRVRGCLDRWLGRAVYIPVVSACEPCNGNHATFTITRIASFRLTGYDGNGPAVSWLAGVFLAYYTLPSVEAGFGGPPLPGDDAVFVGLVR
jgi:Flp pilus assembly protein TadG